MCIRDRFKRGDMVVLTIEAAFYATLRYGIHRIQTAQCPVMSGLAVFWSGEDAEPTGCMIAAETESPPRRTGAGVIGGPL